LILPSTEINHKLVVGVKKIAYICIPGTTAFEVMSTSKFGNKKLTPTIAHVRLLSKPK